MKSMLRLNECVFSTCAFKNGMDVTEFFKAKKAFANLNAT